MKAGSRFESSKPHHAFAIERRFLELTVNDHDVAGLRESGRSLQSIIRAGGRFCPHLSLLAKGRFLVTETATDGDSVRMSDSVDSKWAALFAT
jgi:hypothetical protein